MRNLPTEMVLVVVVELTDILDIGWILCREGCLLEDGDLLRETVCFAEVGDVGEEGFFGDSC